MAAPRVSPSKLLEAVSKPAPKVAAGSALALSQALAPSDADAAPFGVGDTRAEAICRAIVELGKVVQ
mgnify:CR=1 FL=1